jgi:hypothetical protein
LFWITTSSIIEKSVFLPFPLQVTTRRGFSTGCQGQVAVKRWRNTTPPQSQGDGFVHGKAQRKRPIARLIPASDFIGKTKF